MSVENSCKTIAYTLENRIATVTNECPETRTGFGAVLAAAGKGFMAVIRYSPDSRADQHQPPRHDAHTAGLDESFVPERISCPDTNSTRYFDE